MGGDAEGDKFHIGDEHPVFAVLSPEHGEGELPVEGGVHHRHDIPLVREELIDRIVDNDGEVERRERA